MPKETRTYDAIYFRQRVDAPIQVAFVAPSSEVDAWSRVPTKKTGNIRNFQRAEIPRHIKEVQSFFNNTANSSPTSVVVGFDPVRSKGRVRSLTVSGIVLDEATVTPELPVIGRLEIGWEVHDLASDSAQLSQDIAAVRSAVRSIVYAELDELTHTPVAILDKVLTVVRDRLAAGVEVDLDDESPPGDEPQSESATDISIPQEVKDLLSGLSPSEQQVVVGRIAFLAQTDPAVIAGKPVEHLQTLFTEVRDELKPGLLIDGQHRVMGTKKLGRIPFLVTALPLADWPELAFQFIVTNRTAKRVPESLLISIVGNSLSKTQRAQIEERLREANIHVGLIEAVMRIHEDEASPFFGMIAFGLADESGFLDAAAMRGKVIELWYERVAPVQHLFDHVCQGKKRAEKTDFWKSEELWFDYLVAFWGAVRERYKSSNVFSPELADRAKRIPTSKLMTATVLMIFQETVLEHLLRLFRNKETAEGTPIAASLPSTSRFEEVVRNVLVPLVPEFFTEWKLSGFDGSRGARDDLADAIERVITREKSVSQLKDPKRGHRLFRAESGS